MEDLAYLCEIMGFDTGIDIPKLVAVRQILATVLPHERLAGAIAVAGLPKKYHSAKTMALA
jgi:hydroxymethylglutaryl-CoA lyase